jgi:hypothetical protein
MFRKSLVICSSLAFAISLTAGDAPPTGAKLSAAEIVDKNVAARGGLQAWRAVQTMSMSGKLGAGGNQRATLRVPPPAGQKPGQRMTPVAQRPVEEVQLPFVMELARPGKMRFELEFGGQTAIQVFDGANGWKLRPYLGRRVVEPYTTDEMKAASMQADLDGPLVDYAAMGTVIELDGMEKVEGRDTYKVKLTMKNAGPRILRGQRTPGLPNDKDGPSIDTMLTPMCRQRDGGVPRGPRGSAPPSRKTVRHAR